MGLGDLKTSSVLQTAKSGGLAARLRASGSVSEANLHASAMKNNAGVTANDPTVNTVQQVAGAPNFMTNPHSDGTDSFGQTITQQDRQLRPSSEPLPQFVNGVLAAPGTGQQTTGEQVTPAEPVEELTPEKDRKIAQILAMIACVILVIGVGIAIYWLWWRLNVQIVYWKQQTETRNEQIQQLRTEIVGLQEENQLSTASLPVYIDPDGYYSFYKDIPSLSVTASGGVARLFYGETNGVEPISGFVMTIEVLPTNGRALETIVNADYEHAAAGVTNTGKRSENFADHFGFSYVAYEDGKESVYYYLQDSATSKRYAKIWYRIGAANNSEYDYYERVALQVMTNLELYEVE